VKRLRSFVRPTALISRYFTLTALHGLHVLGAVVIFYIGDRAKMWKTDPNRYINRSKSRLFWHFR
jgi:heme/copper-type cytochrome/quinol oxidase subunit 3